MTVAPFSINVSDAEIADLKSRLRSVRRARPAPVEGWERGVPSDYLEGLAAYWRDGFDWRAAEARLNRFPQFTTIVDGQTFHFAHVRSKEADALPLILCHGWPGSFVEYEKLIAPLTDPASHGGEARDAFDVVVPSLPGFGYSVPLASPGWDLARTTHAYAAIMEQQGYGRYMTHGCDIGAGIAGHLASFYPQRVVGVHSCMERLAMSNVGVFLPMPNDLSDDDKGTLDGIKAEQAERGGYAELQGTRPQTLAHGLADSPVGQLAWIVEKFKEWTSPARDLPEDAVDRDQLLANVSLYWFSNTGGSSAQFYYEARHSKAGWTAPSQAPAGYSIFDAHPIVRRLMDPHRKAAFWSEHQQGGHFPAMEAPSQLIDDLRAFGRQLR
jgi:pimeloyl-ACP methyl ester carboxylesterase